MRKKLPHVWEAMDYNTLRCKVIGGWLVMHSNAEESESMCFVKDIDHEWLIMKEEGQNES